MAVGVKHNAIFLQFYEYEELHFTQDGVPSHFALSVCAWLDSFSSYNMRFALVGLGLPIKSSEKSAC